PLIEVTLPNKHTDGKVAKKLLKKLVRVYGQKKGRIFIGDVGYDSRELYDFLVKQLKSEAFIPLRKRNQQPKKVLGPHGLPLCQAGLERYCPRIQKHPQIIPLSNYCWNQDRKS
ncbi:MAG: hypothetical protein HQ517_15755, partial [SAR324 cluster bacterium]|nr:hypothetical protein [SAR324 cluster bacterium]